ncbi:MAG: IscS subfamily cysteine desulfurase, partial [Rhodospirillales bacterium]
MTAQEKNELPHTLQNRKAPIYLDYQATTPTDPRVVEKMLPFFSEQFG